MKKFLVLLMALSTMLIVSCASVKVGGEKVPEWVVTEPTSTASDIYAVGSGKASDFDIAYKMAKADAQNNLTKKISLQVNDIVETAISAENSIRKYEENSTQIAESVLKKADVVEYFEKKDGTVYVLMHMPIKQ